MKRINSVLDLTPFLITVKLSCTNLIYMWTIFGQWCIYCESKLHNHVSINTQKNAMLMLIKNLAGCSFQVAVMADWLTDWLWIIHFFPFLTFSYLSETRPWNCWRSHSLLHCNFSRSVKQCGVVPGKVWVDGALHKEAITSETQEGLESEGGWGRSEAEANGRAARAEAGMEAAVTEDEADLLQKKGRPE